MSDPALTGGGVQAPGGARAWAFASPLTLALAAILLAMIVPPVVFLVNVSLHETLPNGGLGPFTTRFYRQILGERHFAASLGNTLIYAIGSAAIAIVIGAAQALIVERTNAPGRRLAFYGAIMSLGVPHVLYVVAWLLLLGRSGPINGLIALTPIGPGGVDVYSMWGMALIEGVGFTPLVFLMMSAALGATDPSFEESALMSGAGPLRAFWRVTLRMGFPAFCALLLLVFVKAFESFEVPALVGLAGNIEVLTTSIWQSAHATGVPNYGEAGAYSVCLVLIVVGLLAPQSRLSRDAHRYQSVTGKGFRPRVMDLRAGRYAAAAVLFVLFLIVTLAPIAMLVFASFQPFYEGVTWESFSRLSLENYDALLAPGSFRDSIVNTLVLGAATASFVVPFTALCAWLAARRAPGAWVLDQLASAPLVFPALILSVAFLDVFVNSPLPLYGTLLSIIIASSTRFLPYGMRYAFAGALQIHPDLEQAADVAGATRRQVFVRVLLPLLSASLIGSWLLVFLLSVQTVSLPLMLSGPGAEVMAVTLFDLWQNGQVTELASMGVAWIALMTLVSVAFHLIVKRRVTTL